VASWKCGLEGEMRAATGGRGAIGEAAGHDLLLLVLLLL
jgi:hypothetical protein